MSSENIEKSLLAGLNPFQRAMHKLLWDESNKDAEYDPLNRLLLF